MNIATVPMINVQYNGVTGLNSGCVRELPYQMAGSEQWRGNDATMHILAQLGFCTYFSSVLMVSSFDGLHILL